MAVTVIVTVTVTVIVTAMEAHRLCILPNLPNQVMLLQAEAVVSVNLNYHLSNTYWKISTIGVSGLFLAGSIRKERKRIERSID